MKLVRVPGQGLFMHQTPYTKALLEKHGMTDCNPTKIILDQSECEEEGVPDNSPEVTKKAQVIVGGLNWLATRTRPDIAYSTQRAASMIMSDPARTVRMGKRILRYLKGTAEEGLFFPESKAVNSTRTAPTSSIFVDHYSKALIGYTDASFAPDGGKSQQCFIIQRNTAVLFWKTGRQSIIALSTAEAELLAASDGHTALKSMFTLIQEVMRDEPSRVLAVDNSAAISLTANNAGQTAWRTRHLKVRANALREDVESGWIVVKHCPGTVQTADIGTKSLPAVTLAKLKALLNITTLAALVGMTQGTSVVGETVGEQYRHEVLEGLESHKSFAQRVLGMGTQNQEEQEPLMWDIIFSIDNTTTLECMFFLVCFICTHTALIETAKSYQKEVNEFVAALWNRVSRIILGKPKAPVHHHAHDDEPSPWKVQAAKSSQTPRLRDRRRLKFSPTRRSNPTDTPPPKARIEEVIPDVQEGGGSSSSSHPERAAALYIAPQSGQKYHSKKDCKGLNNANALRTCAPCNLCIDDNS